MEAIVSGFNRTIHEPTRLRIVAALASLGPDERMQFVALRDMLDLTDGNLGAHLLKLEEERLVAVDKEFVARKPCTFVSLTLQGRLALAQHVKALKEILDVQSPEAATSQATNKDRRGGTPSRRASARKKSKGGRKSGGTVAEAQALRFGRLGGMKLGHA